MQVYPLKLKPIYKHRMWGGEKLGEVLGKDIPKDEEIGERWEAADRREDESTTAKGEAAGGTAIGAVEK